MWASGAGTSVPAWRQFKSSTISDTNRDTIIRSTRGLWQRRTADLEYFCVHQFGKDVASSLVTHRTDILQEEFRPPGDLGADPFSVRSVDRKLWQHRIEY